MSETFLRPLREAFDKFVDWEESRHPRNPLGRFVKVRFLGGTTGATLVRSKASGKEYVAKEGNHRDQIHAEYTANKLYEAAGVPVPPVKMEGDTQLADYVKGEPLSSMVKRTGSGWEPRDPNDPAWRAARDELRKGFAVDAWLANWDVLGLEMDNVLVPYSWDPEERGKGPAAWRVDNGGSLMFRAQGEHKGAKWGKDVTELDSLRNPDRSAAVVYGGLTDEEVANQIYRLPEVKLRAELGRLQREGHITRQDEEMLKRRLDYLRTWAQKVRGRAKLAAALDAPFLPPLEG